MRAMTFHEEARAEVNEAAKYYEGRVPGLGLLFLVALEEAGEKVLANPEAFQSCLRRDQTQAHQALPLQPPVCH